MERNVKTKKRSLIDLVSRWLWTHVNVTLFDLKFIFSYVPAIKVIRDKTLSVSQSQNLYTIYQHWRRPVCIGYDLRNEKERKCTNGSHGRVMRQLWQNTFTNWFIIQLYTLQASLLRNTAIFSSRGYHCCQSVWQPCYVRLGRSCFKLFYCEYSRRKTGWLKTICISARTTPCI